MMDAKGAIPSAACLTALVLPILFGASARAQEALLQSTGIPSTPRALGMADAASAGGISTTGMYLNPAGVGVGSVFHTEGWYGYSTDLSQHVVGAASVDSTTPIAGGLGFTYMYTGLEAEESNVYDARVSVALPIRSIASLGLNLRYFRADYADSIENAPRSLNDFSLDAGAMIFLERFFLGIAGTNLTNLDHPLAPLALVLAGGLALGPARFEFDATLDWSSYDEVEPMGVKYAVGAEALLFDVVAFRAGYRYEDVPNVHGIAAGIGYVDMQMAFDFGFQQDLSGGRSNTEIGISARYFVR